MEVSVSNWRKLVWKVIVDHGANNSNNNGEVRLQVFGFDIFGEYGA